MAARLSRPGRGARLSSSSEALLLLSLAFLSSVHPSRESSNDFFDPGTFDEMDRQDRISSSLEEGFVNWEERCLKVGGQTALDNWLEAQEGLIACAMDNFNVIEIQSEVEAMKKTGDLDLVFKKYCGEPAEKTRPCIERFLDVSRFCLKSKNRGGMDTMMDMVDSAVNFVCYNSGDRIALFLAENGVDCVADHQEKVIQCLNSSVPELFMFEETSYGTRRRSVDPVIVFNRENCGRGDRLRRCVEAELLKCSDPTPSNVINAMFLAMWDSSPCRRISGALYSASNGDSMLPLHHFIFVVVSIRLLGFLRMEPCF